MSQVGRRTRRQFLQGSVGLAGLGLLAGCAMRLPGSPQAKVHRIGFLAVIRGRAEALIELPALPVH
jgi:hypothetical protein